MSAPFVWIFVCFAAGIISAQFLTIPGWTLFPFACVAACAFLARFRVAFCVNTLLIFFIAACYTQKQQAAYRTNELRVWVASNEKEVVSFQGLLTRTPEIADDYFVLQVRVESVGGIPRTGIARITVSGLMKSLLTAGDRVESFARFRLPKNFRTDGAFDYERYLRSEGIHVLGNIKSAGLIRVNGYENTYRHFSSAIRMRSILNITRSFSGPEGNILRALWLDDRGGLIQSDQQVLMDAGVFHVIAISGFHITVLLFLLFLLLKRFVSFRSAVLIASMLLAVYFLILEGRASVTRSFLSFLIFAFAVWRHDHISLGNWISLSALVQVALNPLELYDSGFHLTYLSTATILFFVVPISRRLIRLRKIYQFLLSFVITGIVLQIVLIPYQIYVFHRIPFSSIIANIVAVPVSSVLIAFSLLLLPCPGLAFVLRTAIKQMIHCFLGSAEFFAEQGVHIFPSPPLGLVFLFYASLVGLVVFRRTLWKSAFLGLAIFVLFIVLRLPEPDPGGGVRIHFLDVGQGDSILIEYPDRTFDLVDGGGFFNPDALDTGQSILIPYLCRKGVTQLHRVFLTHAHADHMNGLITLLKYIPVEDLYVTRQPYGDRGYQYFLRNAAKSPTAIRTGIEFRQGPVRLKVLAPTDSKKTWKVANDDSLVLLLEYERQRILLTGDVEMVGEEKLAETITDRIDFLKVPHHGSKTSSSQLLLQKTKPRIAFVSVGWNNWFGHPHKDVLERYRRAHTLLYRTDMNGTIVLELSRGRFRISYN